jgi:hypothetical protein
MPTTTAAATSTPAARLTLSALRTAIRAVAVATRRVRRSSTGTADDDAAVRFNDDDADELVRLALQLQRDVEEMINVGELDGEVTIDLIGADDHPHCYRSPAP